MDGRGNYLARTPSSQNSLHGALNSSGARTKGSSPRTCSTGTGCEDQEMKTQLERSLEHSITLVYWHKAGVDPVRLQMTVPTFPLFQLSHFSTLIADLGLSATSYLDTYNLQAHTWEQHTIHSVRTVASEQRLLYRARKSLLEGIEEAECAGLQEEMRLQGGPTSSPKMAAGAGVTAAPAKRTASSENASAPPTKVHIVDTHSAVARSNDAQIPSEHPHTSWPAIPYHPHPPLKRWPNDYTVAELSRGFRAMDALATSPTITQRTAFERVFGSRYVKSTVCRHRGVWRRAPASLCAEFEHMGSDERACWGEFVRRVEGRPPGRTGLISTASQVDDVVPTSRKDTLLPSIQPSISMPPVPPSSPPHTTAAYDPSLAHG